MHIEVNVVKSLVKHLYGANDNIALREDCEEARMHRHAWMREDGQHAANWVIAPQTRKAMNEVFSTIRFPAGYGAKFRGSCSRNDAGAPNGLKSHDWHKMMEHLLPVVLRACVHTPETKLLRETIYDLSTLFR
jgi:hypothetical protein